MQNSPFYAGKHLGKDSRVIVYRGGSILGYKEGLYSEHLKEFGELPAYQLDESALLDMTVSRYSAWKRQIREVAPEAIEQAKYESILETNWSPIKINPHGTLEMRGMDINMVSYIFSISAAVKYILEDVYNNELHVTPSEEGIAEYFKEEGR